ncbi:acyl-CoA_dh_1 domain-containing protein [Haematococcus lacustris]|uniref:Acyl-CoA_dh_1 domain-containing protein n=1 Tax=Haematococcus lacustris TaxID=44745 RepID=A0A699ZKZ6_HAELA|nr:acyl-CoA_dh_1 domain-containing protein [Haematococcus lacustris]
MRLVGLAERSIELMATRALQRSMFGRPLARQGAFQSELAQCRVALEGARLLVLHAAAALDQHGNKGARGAIAVAKFAAPNMALKVVDAAIQAHGGAGVSQDTVLARLWTAARTLRIADGPDEVHLGTIAKLELARAAKL